VQADKKRATAREKVEPLVKRAQKAAVTACNVTSKTMGSAADLSKEERRELTMVFKMFDTNKDGAIDIDELEAVLRNLGFRPTVLEVSAIMKEASVGRYVEAGAYYPSIKLEGFLDMMARIEEEEKEMNLSQTKTKTKKTKKIQKIEVGRRRGGRYSRTVFVVVILLLRGRNGGDRGGG